MRSCSVVADKPGSISYYACSYSCYSITVNFLKICTPLSHATIDKILLLLSFYNDGLCIKLLMMFHHYRRVTLLYVGSSWSSCLCSSMYMGPQEYITYEFVQQCPSCLVCLTLTVFVIDSRWPYSCCFVGCCLHDLFNITQGV